MYRLGLVDTLVTHANMKGLGLTPLFRDCHGFMPPQLKTNKKQSRAISTATGIDLNHPKILKDRITIKEPHLPYEI